MLFHGKAITVSAINFKRSDQLDVIKGKVGEVKMDWDGFIRDHTHFRNFRS